MKILTALYLILVLVFSAAKEKRIPEPVMLPETTAEGKATVSPDTGISGEFGTWTVTYTVGASGISEGGGIRVELPDAWHSGPRNSANRLQATDPADDNYVSARCSRTDATLQTIVEHETKARLVKHAKPSLDGRKERYVFVVRVRVVSGRLDPGDTVSVIYGDRSQGSRGYGAAAVSTKPLPILIAVDEDGDNRFELHSDSPLITSLPGRAVEMLFHAPSIAVVDQPIRMLISMVDKESNPVAHGAIIRIRTVKGKAKFPELIEIPEGKGYVEFEAIPKAPGILRLRAESRDPEITAMSNPVDVHSDRPGTRIYWGDLHSHTRFSWDGVGENSFDYARYVSGLDFYAVTDHAVAPPKEYTRGLCEKYWEGYTRLVEKHNQPGTFVTIHAYECSFRKPFGHHNVFFRNRPGPLLYPTKVTLPQLWDALRAGDALTIPHHTGKFPSGIDFSIHNPIFRRNFEIYSGHGLSEAYNPSHPLAFENSLFTSDSKSLKEPTHAQDVWKAGLRLSTIASSDDHRAHPGQPHYGLTAVRAPALTRNDIFQALYDRHTYGTTGSKIILDVTLNDVSMGQVIAVDSSPTIRVRVVGTDVIERVEILRYQPPDESFRVIKAWPTDSMQFEQEYTDEKYRPGAIYYVRLRQKNRVRNRIVMAWSSPIWTKAKENQ